MTSAPDSSNSALSRSRFGGLWLALVLSTTVSLLIVAPFFLFGSASGHDFEFHAASWLDVAAQWKQGTVYPRWMEWANHGFGEPRFIFYPPLSWMLGAALSFLMPWSFVPIALIVLVQALAGVCAYALARRFLPQRAAIFGAMCYAANPYALLIVYMRSDYAELLAMALFPLLFLLALQLAGVAEIHARSCVRTTLLFAITFAAVWLSNAPAGVMASYSVALVFVWAAISRKSCKPLWQGSVGVLLGFGLSAFYLLPAAYEQRWVNIGQVLSSGLQPSQNFLYAVTKDPEHDFFNWIASTIAISMIVMALCAALRTHRRADEQTAQPGAQKLWTIFLLLVSVATVLMLHPSNFLWRLLPKLRFIQFPWRWMLIVAVPFAYFLAAAAARRRFRWLWATTVAALLLSTAIFLVHTTWWDPDDIPTLQEAMANGSGFDGTDEYDPLGDDHYNLPTSAPRVRFSPDSTDATRAANVEVIVDDWTARDKEIRIHTAEPGHLALRLLNYPAWRVELNGERIQTGHPEESGQMIVSVPAGESHVSAQFQRTLDRTVGIGISIASVSLAFFLWIWIGRKEDRI